MKKLFPKEFWLFITLFFPFVYVFNTYYPPESPMYTNAYMTVDLLGSYYIFTLARYIEMPEGQLIFLSAGYTKTQILLYFGLNIIIALSVLTFIFFPIHSKIVAAGFITSMLFQFLFEIVWLRKGLAYANVVILAPLGLVILVGIFNIVSIWHNIKSLANDKLFLIIALAIVVSAIIYHLYHFYKGDIV